MRASGKNIDQSSSRGCWHQLYQNWREYLIERRANNTTEDFSRRKIGFRSSPKQLSHILRLWKKRCLTSLRHKIRGYQLERAVQLGQMIALDLITTQNGNACTAQHDPAVGTSLKTFKLSFCNHCSFRSNRLPPRSCITFTS